MKNLKILSSLIAFLIVFGGCNEEDYTGYSKQVPTNPTISVNLGTIVTVSDGIKSTHTINISMDVAQIVDVFIWIDVLEGTATEGEDFSLSAKMITIPAGRTSAKLDVTVIADEVAEPTETFKIQIGDDRTANAALTPATADFTITNSTSNDFELKLSWASETYGTDGELIAPATLADMVFALTDVNLVELGASDGSGFEGFTLLSTAPDGVYYLATYFFAVYDLGDADGADLDFTLDYHQIGVQTGAFDYPAGLNTVDNFSNTMYLAKITKTGNTYTITKFDGFKASDLNFASSTWVDGLGDGMVKTTPGTRFYANQVVVAGTTGSYTIDGINFAWMETIWGETVTSSTPVNITFNDDGTLEILEQDYLITDYLGTPYPYSIYGDGTWNRFLTPIAINIHYEMNQAGFLVAGYYHTANATTYPNDYFICDIIQSSHKKKAARAKGKTNFPAQL